MANPLQSSANWSDPPTADQVARAIVAASRAVGADPLDVANGVTRTAPPTRALAANRARSYAAKALAKVFTSYPRTRIAGFVGCGRLVRQSYFSALDQRLRAPAGVPWWDDVVLAGVVEAIMLDSQLQIAPVAPLISAEAERKLVGSFQGVPIYEVPSLPPDTVVLAPAKPKPYNGTAPYRPPAGTYEKTLAADAEDEDDGPVFDHSSLGGVKPVYARPRQMSKAEMDADLRDALRRSALMQKPED